MIEAISALILPAVIVAVGIFMLFGKRPYFDSFLEGAREGLQTAIRLLPSLVALLVAIRMLSASGVPEQLAALLSPILSRVGIPAELIPLLLIRPVSGSASTAAYASLLETYGADSFPALCASVIMGSSDTMIYVISVYFSSVGIKKSRYAFPVAATVMLFCILFSCLVCRLLFKS